MSSIWHLVPRCIYIGADVREGRSEALDSRFMAMVGFPSFEKHVDGIRGIRVYGAHRLLLAR